MRGIERSSTRVYPPLYQGVFGARSYLIPLVKLLNTPSIRWTTGSLVAATKGIHLQDTSAEDLTAIDQRRVTYTNQDLFIGGRYRIRPSDSQNYLTCVPQAPTGPHQPTTYPFKLAPRSDTAHQIFTLSYVLSDPAPVVQPQGVAMTVDFYNQVVGASTINNSHPQFASMSPSEVAAVGNRGVAILWSADRQWIIRPDGDPYTTLTASSDGTPRFEYMNDSPMKWTFESVGAQVPEFQPAPPPRDFDAPTPPVLSLANNAITVTYSDTINAASAYEAQLVMDGSSCGPVTPLVKDSLTTTKYYLQFVLGDLQGNNFQVLVRPVGATRWVAAVNTITRLAAPSLSTPAYGGTPAVLAVSTAHLTPHAQTYVGQLVLKGVPTGDIRPLTPYGNNSRAIQFYTNDPSAQVRVRASAPGYLDSPWTTSAPGQ